MGTKRCVRITMLILLSTVFPGLSSLTFARTIYVDDDSYWEHDGSSWGAAFADLQSALAVASAGDEIRVAQGVYRPDQSAPPTPHGPWWITFRPGDGVTIKGGFAGLGCADPNRREISEFVTILSGDLAGNDDPNDPNTLSDNCRTVVTVEDVGNPVTLDGVTITHANGRYGGGGMENNRANVLVRNCTFLNNRTNEDGAGMLNFESQVRLENSRFIRNWAYEAGGGLYSARSSTELIDCEFIENYAKGNAGAAYVLGGNAVFFHCLFRANRADYGPGAIWSGGEVRLLYCTFAENHGWEYAGAILCSDQAEISHCLFYRNSAVYQGAILIDGRGHVALDFSTFYGNVTTQGPAGGIYCQRPFTDPWAGYVPGGTLTVRNCIFWANRAPNEGQKEPVTDYPAQINAEPNAATVEYCCVEGWTPQYGGTGNLGVDPLFVAPDQNDFHLQSQAGHWDSAFQAWVLDGITSPCIDAGDPNSPVEQEPFPNGGLVNLGTFGGTSEASKSWFGTEPCAGVNAADLNGDCRVDAEDYRLAVLRWRQPDR
jgi:hypothetical protein